MIPAKIKSILKKKMPDMRVLIVDDMSANIVNITASLTHMGFRMANITSAENGMQAFMKLAKDQPHLVITDWNMPVVDGLHMVQRMRSAKVSKEMTVLMVTAEPEFDRKEVDPYIDGFIRKPYTPQMVEDGIYMALLSRMEKNKKGRA